MQQIINALEMLASADGYTFDTQDFDDGDTFFYLVTDIPFKDGFWGAHYQLRDEVLDALPDDQIADAASAIYAELMAGKPSV